MIAFKNDRVSEEFIVIHPLFDEPEQKRSGEDLGRMPMSRSVRVCLLMLRGYLILMSLMLAFHLVAGATVPAHP
jgi:hypothetical protein